MDVAPITLPIALVLFLLLLVVLPLVRLRLQTGRFGIVVRNNKPGVETFVRWWTVGLLLGVAVWSVLVATQSAAGLGIWHWPAWTGWMGMAFLGVGFLLVGVAQAQMGASWRIGIDDAPTALVTRGLYRWVRHPIYSGIVAMLLGILFLTPSPWTVSVVFVGLIMIGLQSRLEDEHVRTQHNADFDRWASRVGRLFPGIGRIRQEAR